MAQSLSNLIQAGLVGYTGSTGAGYTGSASTVPGYTGSQGDIGYTGSQGVGYTGSQGDIGYTGSVLTVIPQSTNTTIVSSDSGKHLYISGSVTLNSSTGFSAGDAVIVYNNSASTITLTATDVTLYFAGTALTGNRTITQRGMATILCVATNVYVVAGAGVS